MRTTTPGAHGQLGGRSMNVDFGNDAVQLEVDDRELRKSEVVELEFDDGDFEGEEEREEPDYD